MTVQIKVRGGPETAQALRELGRASSAEKVLRQALRPGANEVLREARALIPVKTGESRKALAIGIKTAPQRYAARLVVGMRQERAWIHHLIEFGTRNTRAQPHMRPAIGAAAPHAVQQFGADIWPRIAREAVRLAARTGMRGR
jgi:HK97 gp10 family phage protein